MPPLADYGKTTNERLWISNEATFNVQAQPVLTDAVIPLPGLAFSPALREFVPSDERSPTAGVSALLKRKKKPSEWNIPLYTKFGAALGTPPSYGLLLKKGFGVETITGGVKVEYTLATSIEELSVSLHHYIDNLLRNFRGGLVGKITLDLSGSEEGKITIEGMATNEIFAGRGALNVGIDATQTTLTLEAGQARRFQLGPVAATDVLFVKIEAEIIKVTAIDYATDILTIVRAQEGSTGAVHSIGAEVAPRIPAADTDPADKIASLVNGTIDLGTLTGLRIISFQQVIDNALDSRLDEYAQDASTGARRSGKRRVTGKIRAYARQVTQAFLSDLEREFVEDAVIRAGTSPGRLTVDMDRLRLSNVAADGGGPEFVFEFDYEALDSSVGNDATKWTME